MKPLNRAGAQKRATAFASSILLFTLAVPPLTAQGPPGQPPRGGGVVAGSGGAALVLSTEETTRLVFMREEEKLARDVYRFLAAKWNLRLFANIARSEEAHFQQVGRLISRTELADPAAGKADGEFTDLKLTALYAELIGKGSLSVKDALEVGVLIEQTDIADLETGLTEAKAADLKRVYSNLLNASYNHLDSFETALELLRTYNL